MTALGLFAAACGATGDDGQTKGPAAETQELHLQPVAAAGPDPFTPSSATRESAPVQPPLPNATGQGIRTVNAATPGLYGGTHRLGSCDVEQQVRALTDDDAKARAFAEASNVEQGKIPDFLRGLTPVVLRADTRVTNHGFSGGRANSFQSVLQAGTAVLVDGHGMPRVRCACGNPLLAPRAAKGSPVQKGDTWSGYHPNQVVVIEPTIQVINNLVIVNVADNTWIERKSGDDGAQDRTPRVPPPYDPTDGIPSGPPAPPGTTPEGPCPTPDSNSLARTAPPGGSRAPAPARADCPPDRQIAPDAPNMPDAPNTPNAPDAPNMPNTPDVPSAPNTPPVPNAPSVPGVPTPPQQPPPDVPADIPSDLPPQFPNESGVPLGPDGPMARPSDPHDSYDPNGPYGVPDQQQPPTSDTSQYLESA
ncbi:DUF6777 domain-containing protein [Streptomyces sp. NPDC060031]|uniref:DUF6777 domain-containing protein n=1 Tax=Streptomyces sp. NPDC060031 TaxID=3347043 RepID=UPI0036A7CC1B